MRGSSLRVVSATTSTAACGCWPRQIDYEKHRALSQGPHVGDLPELSERRRWKGRGAAFQQRPGRRAGTGSEWALAKGYARRDDLDRTESYGRIAGAQAEAVAERAKERGRPQMGSLGAGNHFLEIDVVDEIYDAEVAEVFGLARGRVVVQIHCGSRGLGHEVCGQYIRVLQDAPRRYGIDIPDRELVAAPVDSREGRDYLAAMAAAANYAFANRQVLAHFVRRSFEQVLAGKVSDWNLHQVYDVTHNIAKIEEHQVGKQRMKVVVHRKGATRAFPPRHPELPAVYRETGQPVLVPGSMGTASYVLVGTADRDGRDLRFDMPRRGAHDEPQRRPQTDAR